VLFLPCQLLQRLQGRILSIPFCKNYRPPYAINFFIEETTTSTEEENEEGLVRDVGEEDELGTTEDKPHK